jgi:hypothetical protein
MNETKPGWQTTEFWLALAAKLLGTLLATGVIGDGTVAMRIAGVASAVLTSLGYSVSRAIVKAAGILLLIGLVGTTQMGCAAAKALPGAAEQAIVDCATTDGPKLLQLALSFASQLVAASSDWTGLEAQAEAEGTAVGECAFVEVWNKLHPTPPTGPAPAVVARTSPASLDKLRTHAGGVRWRLSDGTIR